MPFFDKRFWNNTLFDEEINHPFWKDYRTLYSNSLTQREANKIKDFDYVFLISIPNSVKKKKAICVATLHHLPCVLHFL